jgi:hypothetical protein
MTTHHERSSVLDEIDLRQNELIEQLDELNKRIELTIQQHTACPGSGLPAERETY